MVVKKTLRTMMLAAVGVLGSVAVASAQPAPPPDPAAPPAPPAPPADPAGQPAPPPAPPAPPAPPPAPPAPEFGVAPAALPAAPVANAPVPSVAWGNQPAPTTDTTTPAPAPARKGNPLLLTRFDWTNTAAASIFGIGKDQIGSDGQAYSMDFQFRARYSPIADSSKRFFMQAVIGWGAELTNSDSSAKRNEWLFRDMSVGIGYQHKVYKSSDGSISFTPLISANYILPTSKASMGSGRYGTLSLTGGFMTALPLIPKSDWFSDVFIIAIGGWSHLFSKCYTACNDTIAIQRPRLGPDGTAGSSDQLSGGSLAANNARFLVAAYPTIYKDLNLNLSFDLLLPFKREFGAVDCVQTLTGCASLDKSVTRLNPTTTFDVGFSYTLFNMTRIDVGYQNSTSQLAENAGKRVSLFYGVDAAFYTNVSVFIDSILDKTLNLTGGPTAKRAARNTPNYTSRGTF